LENEVFSPESSSSDSAWPLVQQWLASAQHSVEVLKGGRESGEAILHRFGITSRSAMGAVALETGGILFDHGWLRFLGSGAERMRGNLLNWNMTSADEPLLAGALLVAHDVMGGFFAVNGGAFPGESGRIFYMAPDTLQWEGLDLSYSGLLHWGATGDLAAFYESMRWPGWEEEVSQLSGDQGISVYPFLWANADIPPAERSRRPVPLTELWRMQQEIARQIEHLPDGATVRIEVVEAELEDQT
jgi:Protein of unknown function DUF2625